MENNDTIKDKDCINRLRAEAYLKREGTVRSYPQEYKTMLRLMDGKGANFILITENKEIKKLAARLFSELPDVLTVGDV